MVEDGTKLEELVILITTLTEARVWSGQFVIRYDPSYQRDQVISDAKELFYLAPVPGRDVETYKFLTTPNVEISFPNNWREVVLTHTSPIQGVDPPGSASASATPGCLS